MKPQGHIPEFAAPSAHEASDLDVPLLARIAVILAGTLVILVLVVLFVFHHFDHAYAGRTSEAAPLVRSTELPPLPRLQTNPGRDLQEVRAEEARHLDRYAWVDHPQGVAQIPIDRAMILWVKSYTPPPVNAASSTTNAAAASYEAGPTTNASSSVSSAAAASTELQMRQQKARGGDHAP